MKKPLTGEGSRERRESVYGEGGRAVGGQARTQQHKGHLSKPKAEKAVKGVSFDAKKRKLKYKAPSNPLPSARPGDPGNNRPIPEAGANPTSLDMQANAAGKTTFSQRDTSPFQKLRELHQIPEFSDNSKNENQADFVPDPFEGNRVIDREPVSPEVQEERFQKYRKRLTILRPRPVAEIDLSGDTETALATTEKELPAKEKTMLDTIPKHAKITKYSEEQERDFVDMLALPGVVCNNCPASEQCPEYKPNMACAFDEDFRKLPSRDIANLIPRLELIAELQAERAMRAVFLEKRVAGGQLDPNVTRQLEVAAAAAERVAKLKAPIQQMTNNLTVVAQNAQVNTGQGILSKLITGMAPAPTPIQEIVLNPEPTRATETFESTSSETLNGGRSNGTIEGGSGGT